MSRTIFWNVDTQYDFMLADGALYVPRAETIIPKLEQLTRLAKEKNIKVVNTKDYHTPDAKEFSATPDFKMTFPAHCLIGEKGNAFIPATKPENYYFIDWRDGSQLHAIESNPAAKEFFEKDMAAYRNIVITKDEFDVFSGSGYTKHVISALKPKRAVVYGVATNVCVHYAVMGLTKRGVDVFVPTDAIKELPDLPLEATLEQWKAAGAKLIKTNDVCDYL